MNASQNWGVNLLTFSCWPVRWAKKVSTSVIQTQVLMRQMPIASTFGDSTTNDTLWEGGFLWWILLWSNIFTYQTVICLFVLKVVWSTLRLSLVATVLNRPRGLCSHHPTRPALNPSYLFVCLFVVFLLQCHIRSTISF